MKVLKLTRGLWERPLDGPGRESKSRLRCKKCSSFEILLGSFVKHSVLRKFIGNQSILRHILSVNLPVDKSLGSYFSKELLKESTCLTSHKLILNTSSVLCTALKNLQCHVAGTTSYILPKSLSFACCQTAGEKPEFNIKMVLPFKSDRELSNGI